MGVFKKITLRLNESEYKKLTDFSKKHNLSLNAVFKKAIALNFKFKNKENREIGQFLTSNYSGNNVISAIDKTTLHAAVEGLFILRELGKKESDDIVRNAYADAKEKVQDLTEME